MADKPPYLPGIQVGSGDLKSGPLSYMASAVAMFIFLSICVLLALCFTWLCFPEKGLANLGVSGCMIGA